MNFLEACRKAVAHARSNLGCVAHVNAVLDTEAAQPVIKGYTVSDWHDGTTVRSIIALNANEYIESLYRTLPGGL